jgi:hypothetical protein
LHLNAISSPNATPWPAEQEGRRGSELHHRQQPHEGP